MFTLQTKVIILGVLLAIFAGLGIALKVQSDRLSSAQLKIGVVEVERDTAIEAHDALVKEYERQRAILSEREELRKQQEAQNAKLRQTIKEALQTNRTWADASIPASVLQTLQSLPQGIGPPKPDKPNDNPAVPR
jgi:hypothetical protein